MGIKILFFIILFALLIGFVWFVGNVVYLGLKDFFRIKNGNETAQTNKKNT